LPKERGGGTVRFVEYHVERFELVERPTAVVRALVPEAEITQFLGGAFGEVTTVIGAQGRKPAHDGESWLGRSVG
jgi:hypothetical protein